MMHVLGNAVDVFYHHPNDWRTLVRNAMNTDVSWEKSANDYLRLYHELTGN